MEIRAWQVDNNDNTAIVTSEAKRGDRIISGNISFTALDDIPLGHKVALSDIKKGQDVIKYGVPIGRAASDINMGAHLHTHNLLDCTEEYCQMYYDNFVRKGQSND